MQEADALRLYESNIEFLQILKSIKKRSEDFYKNFKVNELRRELENSYFKMYKAELCNNLPFYFFYLQKQIESILNYSLDKIITHDRILQDSKQLMVNNEDKEEKLYRYFFWYNSEKELERLDINRLPFNSKMSIFYFYFISNDPYEKIELSENQFILKRSTNVFNYNNINTITAFRNSVSHGGLKLTDKQNERVIKARESNSENLFYFYNNYNKLLFSIVNAINEKSEHD